MKHFAIIVRVVLVFIVDNSLNYFLIIPVVLNVENKK